MKSKTKKMSRDEIIALYKTYVPVRSEKLDGWDEDDAQKVTLRIENKGLMKTISQKLFKKPRISYVHLDELGSFIWLLCDGQNDIGFIAEEFHKAFGKKAEPLYDRLLKFFEIMESYDFISYKKPVV